MINGDHSAKQRSSTLMKIIPVLAIVIGVQTMRATDVPTLAIYCVSDEAKPGWQHYSSNAFPNVGYISGQPDLSVLSIKSISVAKAPHRSTLVHGDGSREVTEEIKANLVIEFLTDDARKLHELTATHLGSRILFLLGNEALFAPVIRMPIDGSSVSIILPSGIDVEKIRAQLEKLRERNR
jgi:hypothetical protein